MNAPQLPIAIAREGGTGMKHGEIIRDEDIALLPSEAKAHATIVQQAIDQLDQILGVVLDGDVAGGELGAGCIPGLMPAHAGGVILGVAHDQVQVLDLGVPEAIVVHCPLDRFEPLYRIRRGQVLEKEPRRREERVP